MPTGTMKTWKIAKGFGFIVPDDGGDDVFCHRDDLVGGSGSVQEGDKCTFNVEFLERKGKYHATFCQKVDGKGGGGGGGGGGRKRTRTEGIIPAFRGGDGGRDDRAEGGGGDEGGDDVWDNHDDHGQGGAREFGKMLADGSVWLSVEHADGDFYAVQTWPIRAEKAHGPSLESLFKPSEKCRYKKEL